LMRTGAVLAISLNVCHVVAYIELRSGTCSASGYQDLSTVEACTSAKTSLGWHAGGSVPLAYSSVTKVVLSTKPRGCFGELNANNWRIVSLNSEESSSVSCSSTIWCACSSSSTSSSSDGGGGGGSSVQWWYIVAPILGAAVIIIGIILLWYYFVRSPKQAETVSPSSKSLHPVSPADHEATQDEEGSIPVPPLKSSTVQRHNRLEPIEERARSRSMGDNEALKMKQEHVDQCDAEVGGLTHSLTDTVHRTDDVVNLGMAASASSNRPRSSGRIRPKSRSERSPSTSRKVTEIAKRTNEAAITHFSE